MAGSARVVLLHGFAGTAGAWDDVIAQDALPAPIALALPGHRSAPASSWDDALDRVTAAIAAAGGIGAPVIGYSLGARIALGLLARDAIPAAVLISVNPGIDETVRAARRADDARWAALLRAGGTAAFVEVWEAQPLFASQAASDPARRARRRADRTALDAEGLARSLETTGLAAMPDLRDALADRAARAQLLVGAADEKFVALAGDAAARTPDLIVEVLRGVGHDPTLEGPEALARVLARAIARW